MNSKRFLVLRIVKRILFLIIILAFSNALRASNFRDKKITMSLKNVDLEQAIYELGIYGEVKFSYNSKILQKKPKVSIEANNIALTVILTKLLKPYNITYLVINNHIILQKK